MPEERMTQVLTPVRFALPNPCPPVMTVPEAGALFYGLAETASYEAAARGLIPARRVGKRWYVPVAQLCKDLGVPVAAVQLEQAV